MKKLGRGILLGIAALAVSGVLAGCGAKGEAQPLDEKKVTIGVTSGPHQEILEEVAKQAKRTASRSKLRASMITIRRIQH